MQAVHLSAFLPPSSPFTSIRPCNVPTPTPGPNDLLIRVTHVSIQQVDLLYARGRHQNNNLKRGHIHPPFTLGLDFAGTVVSTPRSRCLTSSDPGPATAPDSHDEAFPPGTAVFGTHPGAFATHLALPPRSVGAALHRMPSGLSPRDAAALASGVVSHTAVHRLGNVRAAQTVLVTGVPGNLALVAAQLSLAAGAKVVALARDEGRAAAVRRVLPGATVLGSDGDWVGRVRGLTRDDEGVDVVIDHVGLVKDALSVLKFGGTVVLVGFAGRDGVMERVEINRVLLKGARVVGYRFGQGVRKGLYDVGDCWRDYLSAIEQDHVKAVVDSRRYVGLEDVGRAMDDLENGRLVGKAVVSISGDASCASSLISPRSHI